jgi:hypothetical protein
MERKVIEASLASEDDLEAKVKRETRVTQDLRYASFFKLQDRNEQKYSLTIYNVSNFSCLPQPFIQFMFS